MLLGSAYISSLNLRPSSPLFTALPLLWVSGLLERHQANLLLARASCKKPLGGSLIEPRADITVLVRKRDLSPRSGIDQFVLQEARRYSFFICYSFYNRSRPGTLAFSL
jgi:hypothetical protein